MRIIGALLVLSALSSGQQMPCNSKSRIDLFRSNAAGMKVALYAVSEHAWSPGEAHFLGDIGKQAVVSLGNQLRAMKECSSEWAFMERMQEANRLIILLNSVADAEYAAFRGAPGT